MFRFTIRDVLWLTALVALALGGWKWHKEALNFQLEKQRDFYWQAVAEKEQQLMIARARIAKLQGTENKPPSGGGAGGT